MADKLSFPLPLVESGQRYAPGSLALEITNLRLTPEGTLESIRGPAPLCPDYGSGYPMTGRMYGIFHAKLHDGMRDVTLVRSGTKLYELTGWTLASSTGVRALATGLSSDPNARFPDQFCEVAGKIVWNNGIDSPLIYDGYVILPLGYDHAPGAPTATGPSDTGHPVFRNQGGYSHPGKIGNLGNFFTQQSGALLAGCCYWYVQFEDIFGNRSALSPASGPFALRQEMTQTSYWSDYDTYPKDVLFGDGSLGLLTVNLDDLQKQALVQDIPSGPEGTVARLVYRTPFAPGAAPEPRFVVRIPDNHTHVFPDNTPDSGLGATSDDYIALPRFQLMCAHMGALAVIEGRNVRLSDAGFPGSFRRNRYVPIGADGASPTGIFSFGGRLYATTETSIYRIEEAGNALRALTVTEGHGLVAPNSTAATGLGVLVGLEADGFWSMDTSENVVPIAREEYPVFKGLNTAMLAHATAVWSPRDKEYLCALPVQGTTGNRLIMGWDGQGWRRRRYGIAFESLCVSKDWRRYVLAAGRAGSEDNVWTLDGEVQTYNAPVKNYIFKSQWLKADPNGMLRFNVETLYIGIVESSRADLTVTVWQNGSRDTKVGSNHTIEGVNPATTEVLNVLVLGTGKVRTPRLTWKQVKIRVKSCESFAFDITCTEPTYMHFAAFAFDKVTVDATGARVSSQ